MIKNKSYTNLIKELAITDFKLKYQGSILGYVWSLIKPLAYFGVLYIVFTKIFKLGDSIPYYPIYLLLGVILFGFWADATSMAMNSIVTRGELIRKVYFPRIVLVIASSITSVITLFLNLLVVFVLAYFSNVHFTVEYIWLILLIIEFYVFIVGVSFYLAALFVRFRDVGHIWEVLNQIFFYATPVIYPLTIVPPKMAQVIMVSPLAQIIQDFRTVVLGFDAAPIEPMWGMEFLPHVIVITVFVSGYYVFQKMAAKFAEEV